MCFHPERLTKGEGSLPSISPLCLLRFVQQASLTLSLRDVPLLVGANLVA